MNGDAVSTSSTVGHNSHPKHAVDLNCSPAQRWLWAGGLLPAVANETLQAEFGRFGNVERAIVASHGANAHRHGFVLFQDKQDAQQLLSKFRADSSYVGNTLGQLRLDWARSETKAPASAKTKNPKSSHMAPGFVCICTQKSVQLEDPSHFTRDTHDQQLHDEMEADALQAKGSNVQTMYLPGGGLMAVNPNKNLVIGARNHRMAVFMGKLTNYGELIQKHNIPQPKQNEKGKHRLLNAPELICILYSKMGLAMLSELQGKFAFCMYDPRLVRVLAVRDPQGTFPVAQAYSEHGNLLIACGPYLPAGHRDVIELQPSEYKYGWHAPPLQYEGMALPEDASQEAATTSPAAAKKRKSRAQRKKSKDGASADSAEGEAAQPAQTAQVPAATEASQPDTPSDNQPHQQESGGERASPASRKSRRRRARRRSASANSNNPDTSNNSDGPVKDAIFLPDSLDLGDSIPQGNEDPATDSQQEQRPGKQQPRKKTQSSKQQRAQSADAADAGSSGKAGRNRRRRSGSGSRRASLDLPQGGQQPQQQKEQQQKQQQEEGSDKAASDGQAAEGEQMPRKSRSRAGNRRRRSIDQKPVGDQNQAEKQGGDQHQAQRQSPRQAQQQVQVQVQVPAQLQAAARPPSGKGGRRAALNSAPEQVWVPKGSLPSNGSTQSNAKNSPKSSSKQASAQGNGRHSGKGNGRQPNSAKNAEQQPTLLRLASHKISVGQELDNLGNMLAAGLAGSSPKGSESVQNGLASLKPSGSCGELNKLPTSGGQVPPVNLVC